jgi:hypothetical protein
MTDAVARYASDLSSRDGWMLGRFVVPVERLDELARSAAPLVGQASDPWRLSALIGADTAAAGPRIRDFNAEHRSRFVVDVVECRPLAAGSVASEVGALPGELRIFVELPLLEDPRDMLGEIDAAGAWAKFRTGGITAGAFPTAAQLARAIVRAFEAGVPFKATAGLHHPITGEYALTYEPNAPRAPMFGFLNLFAAATFAQRHANASTLIAVLEDRDADAIMLDGDELRWRTLAASTEQITGARSSLGISFGSCSFEEPVDGLRAMRLL